MITGDVELNGAFTLALQPSSWKRAIITSECG